jgi:hypothetical protein
MKVHRVWSVEEVEGEDGSVSTEWKTWTEARNQFKKVLKKPGYGVTAVRIWENILTEEAKVER